MTNTNAKKYNGGGGGGNRRTAQNNIKNAMTEAGEVSYAQSADVQSNNNNTFNAMSRGSVNSSNSGASVKFAMPTAEVACVEPTTTTNNNRMGVSSSSHSHHVSSARSKSCTQSSSNNFSGASSGSLSSGDGHNNARNAGSAGSSSLSLSSGGSGGGGKQNNSSLAAGKNLKRPETSSSKQQSKQNNYSQSSETSNITNSGEDDDAKNDNMKNKNNNNNNDVSSGSSGSGSDNNGGATSSSGNAAVVTAGTSTVNNNNTSSGSDPEGSGSGSGSGEGGNHRSASAGEASRDYYYAGYGSGPSMASSNQAASSSQRGLMNGGGAAGVATSQQPNQQQAMGMSNPNMPSFDNFQGAALAASSAAVAAGPQAQPQNQRQQAAPRMNSNTRHVVVGTDEGGLPPPPHAFHLRHHSRHHHTGAAGNDNGEGRTSNQHHQNAMPRPLASGLAGPLNGGIPSAIGGPPAASTSRLAGLRLPPSDEQAVLQRVPRTHATVVAHDLPPPPTSSDAWSSNSGSGTSSRSRKRKAATATADSTSHKKNHHAIHLNKNAAGGHPMVASVRLANGGTVDSVNMSDGSPSSSDSSTQVLADKPQSAAMHVTMDDPILRRKISLKQQPSPDVASAPALSSSKPKTGGGANSALKRKVSAMSRHPSADDSSDSAKGSGSDEGYNASSELQSGSGSDAGSDSISSDDDKKKKKKSSDRGHAGGSDKVGVTVQGSKSNSKRTETSSMSSSVLADFSSVMNEDGTIELNSLTRSDSPRSSCTSLSSNGGNDNMEEPNKCSAPSKKKAKSDVAAVLKKDSTHLPATSAANALKRSKPEDDVKKRSGVELDGFGPSAKHPMESGLSIMERSLQQKLRSSNHHHYHSQSTGRKMLEKSFLSAKRDLSEADAASALSTMKFSEAPQQMQDDAEFQEASIYSLGPDVMASVVSYLEPPEAHSFLTTPLSKAWLVTYTAPQELWKILCTSKPFYAKLDESERDSSDSSCSFPVCNDLEMRHLFGRYRLLYTSFVRCMKYLNRLQDDALNGRTPTSYVNSNQTDIYPYNKNTSLKAYFAKARRHVRSHRQNGGSRSSSDAALSITSPDSGSNGSNMNRKAARGASRNAGTKGGVQQNNNSSSRRLGRSMLTDRLLRPTEAGDVDNVNLPWSCAIYSVVNWMVAFADVEGIQIMCLKCLPYLLEDESQRTTAQRAGLTDSVLRAMVLFPDSIELHTVAFHTLVLLARPLGGNEGMLFHTAMVNARGIFNDGSSSGKNGIVIMLDSMRRFAHDEILQAMSCWSLVNVALTPLQKSMLVKLGGLTVTSNAMLQHPYNAEVQFRALFALINLVIPTETRPDETEEMREFEREIFQQLGEVGETTEKEMLDASVGQISNLVVVSMKNFCSSEAILNRACLVLHNLSLNEEYHSILLWTPNCYQMLEWCLGNYPHDHVLQQSAGGTIQRLNATLSADEDLRERFTHSIRAQQQHSLELARQEAVLLQEQEREQEQQQMDVS